MDITTIVSIIIISLSQQSWFSCVSIHGNVTTGTYPLLWHRKVMLTHNIWNLIPICSNCDYYSSFVLCKVTSARLSIFIQSCRCRANTMKRSKCWIKIAKLLYRTRLTASYGKDSYIAAVTMYNTSHCIGIYVWYYSLGSSWLCTKAIW